jgi:hypothetical protein
MAVARKLMVFLIALSVAMLPAVGGRMAAATPTDAIASDTSHHSGMPCHKTSQPMDDCATMIGCALKCFSFSADEFSTFLFPPMTATAGPSLASPAPRAQPGTPPFRPPRI